MQSRYIKLNVDIQSSDSDREYFIYGIQYKQRVGRIDPPEPRPLESLSNTWGPGVLFKCYNAALTFYTWQHFTR